MPLDKILTKKKFTALVEDTARKKRIPYMDAIIEVCEEREIDPLDIKRLISDSVKAKVEAEAMSLNMLPKGNELPFDD
jgi:hypothetical protein